MAFAKPYECEQLLAAVPHHQPDSRPLTSKLQQQQQLNHHQQQPPANNSGRSPSESKDSPDQGTAGAAGVRVRSWSASEQWLTPQQFIQQLHSPPYNVLLGCDSWRACSNMVSSEFMHTLCIGCGLAACHSRGTWQMPLQLLHIEELAYLAAYQQP